MSGAMRKAVIDIGTNSIKLLVADVKGVNASPVWEGSRQTRLGQGFYESHFLQSEAIQRSAEGVRELAETARSQGAAHIRVFATSAARDARNPQDLLDAVRQASGLSVEIISGDQEADWAFRGAATDTRLTDRPLVLLDVGGGSTEFILGQGGRKHFQYSFPLGTVRLLERIPHSDPPTGRELEDCTDWVRAFMQQEVIPRITPAIRQEQMQRARLCSLVGTGGTSVILGKIQLKLDSYDRDLLESTELARETVGAIMKSLWNMPLAARQQVPGLPANRADVILTGAVIFAVVLEQLEMPSMRVSTRGLRFGAILD